LPSFEAQVKVRYKSAPVDARITADGDHFEVEFARGVRAITPGQAAVIYDGERVIGGGVISRAFNRPEVGARRAAAILR
jgi:tRNA-specific 2-thiouridylase